MGPEVKGHSLSLLASLSQITVANMSKTVFSCSTQTLSQRVFLLLPGHHYLLLFCLCCPVSCVVLCGPVLSYVVLCGPVWSCVVLCGSVWSYSLSFCVCSIICLFICMHAFIYIIMRTCIFIIIISSTQEGMQLK